MFFCTDLNVSAKVQKNHETTKKIDDKNVLKNDNYDRSTLVACKARTKTTI